MKCYGHCQQSDQKYGMGIVSLDQLLRRLVRRPVICALIAAFALTAGYIGWTQAHGEAESQANVIVVPPWSFEDENFPNPMLNLTDRATALANVVVAAMKSSNVATAVAQTGATSYAVTNLAPDSLRAPTLSAMIQLSVKGPSEVEAHNGAQVLISKARDAMVAMQLQVGVGDPAYQAKLQVVTEPEESMEMAPRKIRFAAVAGIAALIMGMLAAFGYEAIVDRRARRRGVHRGGAEARPEQELDQQATAELAAAWQSFRTAEPGTSSKPDK